MAKHAIITDQAPAAIGPYSQATEHNGTLYLSGQIPLDPATGKLVMSTIEAQTARVMENLGAVLTAAGATFDDVLMTTIFLKDLGDFAAVNRVYESYLTAPYPARATVQVAALPRDVGVEISMVAQH